MLNLLAGRLNVNVDLLRSASAKDATSKHKQANQNHDYKNRQNGYDPGAAATSTFFCHAIPSLSPVEFTRGLLGMGS